MALNKAKLKSLVDSLSKKTVKMNITSRKERAWVMVSPNRLVVLLASGMPSGKPIDNVVDIDGNKATILLPEPEQLSLGAKAQPVSLVDKNGDELLIDIETVELVKDGVKTTIDTLSGKGSPHLRVPRTQQEIEDGIRHCLNCLAIECQKASEDK